MPPTRQSQLVPPLPLPHIAARLLFSLKFGHAIPEITGASEFMSLAVAPRLAGMYITR